ncbi:hypothetical protein QYE76_054656 [Lolium multiflorum]|uniref:DUF3615 domain-containing protein n=1 Tax=Lolium multiflorum TaxID=4521 RepID=A0AAD8SZ00_LOLMU|nr:hypothetical protein QYE76_054656 [Lolium multiflorum]
MRRPGRYGVDHNCLPPSHDIESPAQFSPPDFPSPVRSSVSRRRRRSASPHPLPYHRRSPHRDRYPDHHQRSRGEGSRSRSPRLHSSPNRAKQSRLGSGHEDSSSSRRRCRYQDQDTEWYSAERLHSSSVRDRHDHGARSLSPLRHSPSRMSPDSVDTPLLHDGSKSPTDWPDSPIHCYKHYENNNDGSGITDREYNALVDNFMDAVVENWHEPANFDQAKNKELYRKQTRRFAELALKRYNKNKNNKVKYSLVEAVDGAIFFEGDYFHAHVNFYANASNGPKKNGPKVLVFAELEHVGLRLNAMALRSFHFLDEKKQTVGHRDLDRGPHTSKDRDIHHCYACTDKIKHPEGSGYKAGHFVGVSYYHED